ncbi:hypothetical protein Z985_17780 [Salmonella enterica subsp. enterica]|nr:hypothetical protein [Salmonella enterica subsp. enterica]EJS4816581.1 hypothetical protein [Salmonella enterica subsp. enterica serovar Ouakam]MID78784.1 hypothetical protein [Salmonella enterica subsp. enterica]
MTQRVIAQNGSSVSVATTSDIGNAANLPAATTTTNGVVKKMTNQNASTATDVAGVVTDLNALITKLKAAGMM